MCCTIKLQWQSRSTRIRKVSQWSAKNITCISTRISCNIKIVIISCIIGISRKKRLIIILSSKQCCAVTTCRLHIGIPQQFFIFNILFASNPTRIYMKKFFWVSWPWPDDATLTPQQRQLQATRKLNFGMQPYFDQTRRHTWLGQDWGQP